MQPFNGGTLLLGDRSLPVVWKPDAATVLLPHRAGQLCWENAVIKVKWYQTHVALCFIAVLDGVISPCSLPLLAIPSHKLPFETFLKQCCLDLGDRQLLFFGQVRELY
ncbi:hypothetical protein [uncultured Nostoc sp.]|uniref:hypothetical protein n=1 Tax=uncultured Nostoc sp. TaxID=340711 RepID=UPI0035CC9310